MIKQEFVEEMVTQYDSRQSESMPAHNKSVLRSMVGREFDFWEGEQFRQDNHTGQDDQ